MQHCTDIVLIGPMGAGKTSVATRLGQRLNLPVCSLDALRQDYYRHLGADFEMGVKIEESRGYRALYEHCRPYRYTMTEMVLQDHRGSLFDFGAEDSVYEDTDGEKRLTQALSAYPNVFWLLPAEDPQSCMLAMLGKPQANVNRAELNKHFLQNPSYARLAKHKVVVGKQNYDEVADAILRTATL